MTAPHPQMSRRGFLGASAGAAMAVTLGSAATPALGAAAAATDARGRLIPAGKVGTILYTQRDAVGRAGVRAGSTLTGFLDVSPVATPLTEVPVERGGLERFATEVRNLQRTEVREVEEPFASGQQKGSSAMPHKRNPIRTERITGLARVLRGYAQTGLENVALWHERDISHSGAERVILPDATIGLDYMQDLAAKVTTGMNVRAERMRENLELTHGALFSQRALTALVESGLTRDEAYRIVQENAQRAWDTGTEFRDLLAEATPELDLDAIFDYGAYLTHVPTVFERLEALRG